MMPAAGGIAPVPGRPECLSHSPGEEGGGVGVVMEPVHLNARQGAQ